MARHLGVAAALGFLVGSGLAAFAVAPQGSALRVALAGAWGRVQSAPSAVTWSTPPAALLLLGAGVAVAARRRRAHPPRAVEAPPVAEAPRVVNARPVVKPRRVLETPPALEFKPEELIDPWRGAPPKRPPPPKLAPRTPPPPFLPPAGLLPVRRLGTSSTWEAIDESGVRVALRPLPRGATDVSLRRLLDEVQRCGRVISPHVARVHGVRTARDGGLFLVSDLVRGETVLERLQRGGPMRVADVVRIGAQVSRALAAAASMRVAHGGVRFQSIVIGDVDDAARLVDFVVGQHPPPSSAADVHALGVVLTHLLTARRGGRAPAQEPPELQPLLERMLREAPAERPTPAQVAAALARIRT